MHRLDHRPPPGLRPGRHVKTRLYFTSESHLHALINVLRYATRGDGTASASASRPRTSSTTHTSCSGCGGPGAGPADPRRHRVEVGLSVGAAVDDIAQCSRDGTVPSVKPRAALVDGITVDELNQLMAVAARMVVPAAEPAEP